MKDTAILVTTFLRDDILFRCLRSIRKQHPDIAVFVGDNGRPTAAKRETCRRLKCELLELPFDLGVGGVRNEALKRIPKQYEYIVICEDDIIFDARSKLSVWRSVLKAEPTVGIVGGLLVLPGGKEQHYEGLTWIEKDTHYICRIPKPEWREAPGGCRYYLCDIVLNVFMMRRRVWEECPWDPQFKTALEHSDFFLGLKKTNWKVAYTPDVVLIHARELGDTEYNQYRNRPIGWLLFAGKHKIAQAISDFSQRNPIIFSKMTRMEITEQDRALEEAIRVLDGLRVKWWLEAGTCLGAVREHDFIAHDRDMDIGIAPGQLKMWPKIKAEFLAAGFTLYKEWLWQKKKIEISFFYNGKKDLKIDLFFFYKRDDVYWHGAFGPDEKGQYRRFLPHVFPTRLFKNLEERIFKGKRVFLPSPPEDYLAVRYGKDWRTPKPNYTYWADCQAIDMAFMKPGRTVFIGGVWDLLHVGHLNILGAAKKYGRLVVGVLTDEAAMRYKPVPIIPYDQRRRLIDALSIVDEVIQQNDKDPTRDFQRLDLHPDYIVHGDDWNEVPGAGFVRTFGGKPLILPYTQDMSSSSIKAAIREGRSILQGLQDTDGRIAVCIKTFFRDQTLFRSIDLWKKRMPGSFRFYIADDGPIGILKDTFYRQLEDVGHIVKRLPYNTGISFGRNALLKDVKEQWVLLADDDIVPNDAEIISKLKAVLEGDPRLGVVAPVLYLESGDYFGNINVARGLRYEFRNSRLIRLPARTGVQEVNGVKYQLADQVPNFFLARREVFNDVLWDERIKVEYEHMDFFVRLAKTRWRAAVCLDAQATHLKSISEMEYNQFRRSSSPAYFLQKHGLGGVTNQF